MTDKSDPLKYWLIRGVFHPEDAKHLLMTLIQDKIRFHQRSNWSQRERFGAIDATSARRIDELQQTRMDLAGLLDDARAAGVKLQINCTIDIAPSQS